MSKCEVSRVLFRSEWRWRYWIIGVTFGNCYLHHHTALWVGPWCGSMDVRKP